MCWELHVHYLIAPHNSSMMQVVFFSYYRRGQQDFEIKWLSKFTQLLGNKAVEFELSLKSVFISPTLLVSCAPHKVSRASVLQT